MGTVLAIRKFHSRRYTADELVRIGTLSPDLLNDIAVPSTAGATFSSRAAPVPAKPRC